MLILCKVSTYSTGYSIVLVFNKYMESYPQMPPNQHQYGPQYPPGMPDQRHPGPPMPMGGGPCPGPMKPNMYHRRPAPYHNPYIQKRPPMYQNGAQMEVCIPLINSTLLLHYLYVTMLTLLVFYYLFTFQKELMQHKWIQTKMVN